MTNKRLDFGSDLRIFFEVNRGVFLALTYFVAVIGIPCARLIDKIKLNAKINNLAQAMNAFTVHDLEFGLTERGRNLVLHHFHSRFVADYFVALFNRAYTANIEADRRIELERITTGGGFR